MYKYAYLEQSITAHRVNVWSRAAVFVDLQPTLNVKSVAYKLRAMVHPLAGALPKCEIQMLIMCVQTISTHFEHPLMHMYGRNIGRDTHQLTILFSIASILIDISLHEYSVSVSRINSIFKMFSDVQALQIHPANKLNTCKPHT